jgi:hypothetical protein
MLNERFQLQGQPLSGVLLASALGLVAAGLATPARAAVTLATGSEASWQATINSAAANETFVIPGGIHRMGALSSPNPETGGTLTPRSGDTFIGQDGAELRGTKVLTGAPTLLSGNIYYWSGQTQNSYNPYPSFNASDANLADEQGQCWRGNELFEVDASGSILQRYKHVLNLASLDTAGEWFMDSTADRVYIYGDPGTKKFEVSCTKTAFDISGKDNVTLENLTVSGYANLWHQTDAINGQTATKLTLRNVESDWNHGSGANVGDNSIVEGCRFYYNGLNGMGGSGHNVAPIFVRNTDIGYNGKLPYGADTNGAMKIVQSVGGLFEQNWVHDNNPVGIWFDIANKGNILRSNLSGNTDTANRIQQRSIFYEISGDVNTAPTLIYWNQIREGLSAGIDISSSANVSVFENRISTGNGSGLTARANNDDSGNPRQPGLYKYRAWGNDVLLSDTTHSGRNQEFLQTLPGEAIATTLSRIDQINYNTYRGAEHFSYFGVDVPFAPPGWQSNSTDSHLFDSNGSFTTSLTGQPGLPSFAAPYVAANYGPWTGKRTGYWRLDESSGTTASDSSGNGYNGTLNGNPSWQAAGGQRKGALDLEQDDGTADYVTLSTVPGSATDLTVAFWMKPDETNRNMVPISKANNDSSGSDSGKGWAIRLTSSGGVTFRIGGQIVKTDLTVANAYTTGWTHVAATFSGGTAKLYINGVQRASQSGITQTVNNTLTALRFGNNAVGTSEPYDGLLDDVQIFSSALSSTDIVALAEAGSKLKPLANWKLNQGTGPFAPDDSGNAHCGTLMPAAAPPTWTAGKQGNALGFDGTTQYVTVPGDSSLDLTGDLTLSAWVKLDNLTGYRAVISKDADAYELNIVDGKIRLETKLASGASMRAMTTNAVISTGTWYYVTGVRNGSTIKLYCNGVLQSSGWVGTDTGSTGALATNTNPLEIGRRSTGGLYFDGTIDEAEVYDRALSADEILAAKDR